MNGPMTMWRKISCGVAGVITDEPGVAVKLVADRARLGRAERLMLTAADLLALDLTAGTYRGQSL